MKNVALAQKNHEKGLWTDEMLDKLVVKGAITMVEKDTIKVNTLAKLKK